MFVFNFVILASRELCYHSLTHMWTFSLFSALTSWPAGTWAIPQSVYGCPLSDTLTWVTGSITMTTSPGTRLHSWSEHFHLRGPLTPHQMALHVCVKMEDYLQPEVRQDQIDWPAGTYCILAIQQCPKGTQHKAYNIWNPCRVLVNKTYLTKYPFYTLSR